jgi:hypothetical protein
MSSISNPSVVIPKISGTAIFTNSTNNINLLNIGRRGLEIGDVITVSGASSNDKDFTVGVITDENNIIVNQAHAGGTTTKSLVNETAAIVVTLVCRGKVAPVGLGQGWVDVTASRSANTIFTAPANRSIQALISTRNLSNNPTSGFWAVADGNTVARTYVNNRLPSGNIFVCLSFIIPIHSTYKISNTGGSQLFSWNELQ